MTLEDLRALEAAATPGPWGPYADTHNPLYGRVGSVARIDDPVGSPVGGGMNGSDARLIASIRNALPALLTIAEALPEDPWFVESGYWYCGWCLSPVRVDHKPSCRWLAASTALATLEDR